MLKLCKTKQPPVLLVAFLLVIAFHVANFLIPIPSVYPSSAPLTKLLYVLLQMVGPLNIVAPLFTILLIFVQAVLLNNILDQRNYFSQPTFLTSVIYIVTSSLLVPFLSLHPVLLAHTFIIPLLGTVFGFYDKSSAYSNAFDAGLLISIASLFYLPSLIFLLFVLLSLNLLRTFDWREWIILLIGLLLPYYLVGTYYFWEGGLLKFLQTHFAVVTADYKVMLELWSIGHQVILAIVILITLLSVGYMQNYYFRNVVRLRNYQLVTFVMFIVSGLGFLGQAIIQWHSFYFMIIPLSVIWSYYFNTIQIKKKHEFLFFLLLLLIILNQYWLKDMLWVELWQKIGI